MTKRQIGTVQMLWRYPVKSLRGEPLDKVMIDEYGVAGDRRWALRELDRGGIMSARVWAALLDLRAKYIDTADKVEIDLGGSSLDPADPSANATLTQALGRRVQLEQVRRNRPTPAELDAIVNGSAYPPARDFFDEDVMHVIASGTLAHLRTLNHPGDFDPRRFRANIYIDTGDDQDGFIEDGWLDGELHLGDAVRIVGMRPAIRCVMTTHPQPGLPRDMSILRTAAQHHGAYVGVFASVGESGMVRIGDPVLLAQ